MDDLHPLQMPEGLCVRAVVVLLDSHPGRSEAASQRLTTLDKILVFSRVYSSDGWEDLGVDTAHEVAEGREGVRE